MTSLIRQLNAARAEQSRSLREGAARLEDLKIDSVRSQEREQEAQRLETLRESRGVNPRQTANNFARLLENDGGFGAAIAFGITSAQADFADKIDSRISDSRNRLAELRQIERDDAADRRVQFDQQSTINNQNNAAATADVVAATADRDRQDTIAQREVSNANAARQTDISQQNADTNSRRVTAAIESEELDNKLKLIDLNAETETAIRGLTQTSAATDVVEKAVITEFVAQVDSQPGANFLTSFFVTDEENSEVQLRNKGKFIAENKDVLLEQISRMTPENAQIFANRISGVTDPVIKSVNDNIQRSEQAGIDPQFISKARRDILQLAIFDAQIDDIVSNGDQSDTELTRLRQRRSILKTALQIDSKELESLANGNGG